MSLMRMATKVAIGFAIAKGIGAVQKSGGLGKAMEQMKGAGADALNRAQTGGAGGLSDIMGRLGGGGAAAGGLGGLGGLLGGLAATRSGDAGNGTSLEDLLSRDNPPEEPPAEESAGLMIRAMVMAARCDGEIDANERETLMATIGEDATPQDMDFVRAAMDAPVDAQALASDTPQGMETQVYSMSLMAIEPDHPAEAKYLHELATALGIGQATVNEIHDSFGVQRLYS
ncbi:MAG: tellurite resistance TerB family protein [Pseudomonadota bacterium]